MKKTKHRPNVSDNNYKMVMDEGFGSFDKCLTSALCKQQDRTTRFAREHERAKILHQHELSKLKNEAENHRFRAERYKFTTAVYGVTALFFLLGWIYL